MATFNIQGKVLKKSVPLGLSFAKVQVFHLGRSAPVIEATTEIDGSFDVSFPWAEAGRPDIHFRVTQLINGVEQVIYNENPAVQTRHNIADVLAVTLRTDDGLAASPPLAGRPYDRLFVFTRVGNIGVDRIHDDDGYADSDTDPTAPNSAQANAPFGATLDLAGWFGEFSGVYRYKVQYTDAAVLDDATVWHDVDDPLANSYYDFDSGNWTTVPMGPIEDRGQINVYKLPYIERPGQPWIFPDRIAQWDTSKLANELYTLRIQGFAVGPDGTTLVPSAALILPAGSRLKLRIDNTAPVVKIHKIEHAPAGSTTFTEIPVCKIVDFETGLLRLEIEASDAEGHLGSYRLAALFGHSQSVTPPPPGAADSYAGHVDASRQWKNSGTVTVEYDAATYSAAKMPTCAYQFRLNAAKRTTNGYGPLFAGEDTAHITLQRE